MTVSRDLPDTSPALGDAETCATYAKAFYDDFRTASRAAGLVARWRGDWMMYYARDEGKAAWGDNLYPEGKEGEKVRMRSNMLRAIIRHLYTMTTAGRPVVDPRAKNSDQQSIKQVEIGRAIADEYLKGKKVYKKIDTGTELGLVTGAFVYGKWNKRAGGMFIAPPAPAPEQPPAGSPPEASALPTDPPALMPDGQGPPQPVFRGDCEFSVLTPLDVGMDLRASDWDAIWKSEMVVREWLDRYEVAAEHPLNSDAILKAPTRGIEANTVIDNELPTPGRVMTAMKPSNLIEVCTYFKARSAAVPNGRRLQFLQYDGTPLDGEDGPLPYDNIPIWRIAASDVLGSPIAYTPTTELAPLQEAYDKAMSAMATRMFAFGVPNIVMKRGASPDVTQLTGGANCIEVDSLTPGDKPVEVLDLLQMSPEMFKFPEMLTQTMGTLSGVNSVVQGNPPPGLDAGVAIAQFQAMAVQFASSIQQAYAECIEDVVLWIFEALRKHSESIPRTVQLVGKSKREAVEEFYGKDLEGIQRVTVDMGNPLSRTAAGKALIADFLRNSGMPVSPEQFLQVLNTGSLDPISEGITAEMDLIKQENEMLGDGQPVAAEVGENHALHIREHRAVLSNPDIKFSDKANFVREHMKQHLDIWLTGDPMLGVAMGAIPMGGGMPPGPGGPPGAAQPSQHAPPPHGEAGALPKVMQPPPLPGMSQH